MPDLHDTQRPRTPRLNWPHQGIGPFAQSRRLPRVDQATHGTAVDSGSPVVESPSSRVALKLRKIS